jgi:hypothetical protein
MEELFAAPHAEDKKIGSACLRREPILIYQK